MTSLKDQRSKYERHCSAFLTVAKYSGIELPKVIAGFEQRFHA